MTDPVVQPEASSGKRAYIITVAAVVLVVAGLFLWQSGFSFDISRFFAASPEAASCGYRADQPHQFGWAVLKAEKTELGGEPYHVREATYHSDTAGCAPTTEEPGLGGSGSGPTDCNGGNDDCYVYRWNPNAGEQCGRYQLDSGAYRDSDGGWIPGAGIGVVLNWGVDCTPPPAPTHLVCSGMACVPTAGAGADQCSADTDCWKLSCVNNTCAKVVGTGGDEGGCTTEGAACGAPPTHTVCNESNACVSATGPGASECSVDADCAPAETHLVCGSSRTCEVAAGAGRNECATDADCAVTPLVCTSAQESVAIGDSARFTVTGGTGSYTWYAPTGNPDSSAASDTVGGFQTRYASPGYKSVVVVSGNEQAACAVTVPRPPQTHSVCNESNACVSATGPGADECSVDADCVTDRTHLECRNEACVPVPGAGQNLCDTDTDCEIPREFSCEPSSQNVDRNEYATVRAIGGVASLSWQTPDAQRRDGTCGDMTHCDVRYSSTGTYTVTVTDSRPGSRAPERMATCTIRVSGGGGGGGGGGSGSYALTIDKLARNVLQGVSEQDSVNARPGETVEFVIRVTSTGTATVRNVIVRDVLPAGLSYIPGSTTLDGSQAVEGIVTSGLNIGDMPRGRIAVIRFRATVAAGAVGALTDTASARGETSPEVSDTARVVVTAGAAQAPASPSPVGQSPRPIPVTQVPTGPGETTVVALIIAAIASLLYVGYTGTEAFRRREARENIDVARRDKDRFDFKR